MPVKLDSPYARLPILRVETPSGSMTDVVSLRLLPSDTQIAGRHRVIAGEAVDSIARAAYGDERLWWRILDANPLVYPLDVQPGDVLDMPSPGPATRVTRARRF